MFERLRSLFKEPTEEDMAKKEYDLYVPFMKSHGEKPLSYNSFLKRHFKI